MPALAIHMADNAAQLSKEVTTLTNGSEEVTGQIQAMCLSSPFKIDTRAIDNLTDVERRCQYRLRQRQLEGSVLPRSQSVNCCSGTLSEAARPDFIA